ncbi:hypothetical protein OAX78_01025 [Planctomycetota bacterium]|nr:hypothetical protein [Planctomycetota bacterium]
MQDNSRVGTTVIVGVLLVFAAVATDVITSVGGRSGKSRDMAPIGSMKTISAAQALFRESDKEQDGRHDYGTLTELSQHGQLVDSLLGSGTKQGYTYQATYSARVPEFQWMATAAPVSSAAGDRFFATNQDGVVYHTTAGPIPLDPDAPWPPAGCLPVGK